MKAYFLQRVGAYIIDMIILIIATSIIGSLLFNSDNIIELKNKYSDLTLEYYDVLKDSIEEKNNKVDKPSDDSSSSASGAEVENSTSKKENESTKRELETINQELEDASYHLQKAMVLSNITSIIIYILYFVVFQTLNHGQTIGKKVLKICVLKEDGTEPTYADFTIRGIILYGFLANIVMVIAILFLSKDSYMNTALIVNWAQYLLFIICVIVAGFSSNKQGIHDKLAHTEVLQVRSVNNSAYSKWENVEKNPEIVKETSDVGAKRTHTKAKSKGESK